MKDNIDILQDLKDRMKQLEQENDNYGEENEDLRQLSLDGYQMAQNAQKLQAERESLSVDLADKSNTIKKLLEDNEILKAKLRQAQGEA